MTTSPLPSSPAPAKERTFPLSKELFRYKPGLFAFNLFMWGMVHASPALLTLAVSGVFRALEQADGLKTGGQPINPAIAAAWVSVAWFAFVRLSRFGIFYGAFRAWIELWYTLDALVRRNLLSYLLTARRSRRLPDTPAEAVSRFRDDVEDVAGYTEVWVDGAGFVLYSVVAITLMARVDPLITALVCTPLLLMVVFVQRLSPTIRTYRRRMREATARVTDFIGETFGAVSAVKLAAREDGMVTHLRSLGETRRHAALRDVLLTELIRGVNTNMVNLAVGLVLLLGANKVRGGTLDVADFVLFIGLLPRLTGSMGFFGDAIARHRRTGVSYDRMTRLLQDAPDTTIVEHHDVYLNREAPAAPPAPTAIPLRELRVDGLTALHPSGLGVHEASFSVQRGEFVVITGRIGSGKSTLLRAVLGLIPTQSGTVAWNGEIQDDPASFLVPPRSAYTAQLPNLFSDTLRENITSGADEAHLNRAVQLAVLEPDLHALSGGLDTPVGARGVKLSGGQIQRAAVARMLARPADLLVFDDVSSALDARTEAQLWQGLAQTDATCLVVSHRRAALLRADRILLMEGGRITDEGTLPDLLERSDEMRALWAEQDG
ncbi:ABC transporter ATP-binding protein [Deinococcus arenae]|uniref:ABC transporter ATP-binding protein n=1 Tax=Deinococcus arenae TaxID=1452751 RepID=A0A8H9GS66_9DEIO|nr:ABC transporter ATP-binding protein [Deinococcus arenae]AWT36772.1 ABC transporter ATP-binding protein [Deinococcus actinosclerus]GGM55600.1 ABC transporter ATP-binding protein [Deinococcus arenae]